MTEIRRGRCRRASRAHLDRTGLPAQRLPLDRSGDTRKPETGYVMPDLRGRVTGMSQRSFEKQRGEPASETSLTPMTATAPRPKTRPKNRRSRPGVPPSPPHRELGLVAELPARTSGDPRGDQAPTFEVTSPVCPELRDNGVHEELVRIKQENAQLYEALRSRTVLGQATGLLMATLNLSPDEAFAALTTMSSHENRKVRDVAADVVAAAKATRAVRTSEDAP